MSVDPSASGGVITPVEDSKEMTQVYPIMPARIYCRRVIDNHTHHFKDIDGNIFSPFVVGESCLCDNLGRIFQIPLEFHIGAPTTP
jgi:hypothetical protein